MIKEKEPRASSKELNVILHWTDEVKRRAPGGKQP
jgi:hypothetical protein